MKKLRLLLLFAGSIPFLGNSQIIINEVQPGSPAMIEIQNTGSGTVDLTGYVFCSRANGGNYLGVSGFTASGADPAALAPGEIIAFTATTFSLQSNDELALYRTTAYTDPSQILAYTRWGVPTGNGRIDVAVTAGLWEMDSTTVFIPAGGSTQFDGDGQTGVLGYNVTTVPTIGSANSCMFGGPDAATVHLTQGGSLSDTIFGVTRTDQVEFYVENTGNADTLSYWYIITTEEDSIITWVNANMMRDSAFIDINAPEGICHVWGWSYRGLPNPIVGDHISTLNDNVCEEISSNWITVIRQDPDGGTVHLTAANGGGSLNDTIRGIVGTAEVEFFAENTGTADRLSYWYIITDDQDSIITWVNANTMRDSAFIDVNATDVGICHVWGWSYRGLADPVVGEHISTLADDTLGQGIGGPGREAISSNWITVVRTDNITSVEDINASTSSISVYPNPARDRITIEDDNMTSVKIISLTGATLFTGTQKIIDTRFLASGVYFIQIQRRNGSLGTRKIIKE